MMYAQILDASPAGTGRAMSRRREVLELPLGTYARNVVDPHSSGNSLRGPGPGKIKQSV
jgi:hypothetical protein